ncbi:hypothetical protein WN48_07862 [Eufriesea mexicana]|nr:hypothetical protein WN48_07862 [Eufriesea mexicana]
MENTEWQNFSYRYTDSNLKLENQVYKIIRKKAVTKGGSLGVNNGRIEMAMGGIIGGIAVDVVASLITGKPHGIIEVANDIKEKVEEDKSPIKPFMQGALMITTDAVDGLEVEGKELAVIEKRRAKRAWKGGYYDA